MEISYVENASTAQNAGVAPTEEKAAMQMAAALDYTAADGLVTMAIDNPEGRRTEVLNHPDAISLLQSNWENSGERVNQIVGDSTDWNDVTAEFSPVLDLDQDWESGKKVVMSHRGYFNNGIGIPENSLSSIKKSLSPGQYQMNSVEIDVISLKDGTMIMSHDFTPNRTTLISQEDPDGVKAWSEYDPDEVIGEPIIIRDINDNGEYTGEFVVSDDEISLMTTAVEYGLDINSDATFYLDARNDDPARTMVELRRADLHENSVVKVYAYDDALASYGGRELARDIKVAAADDDFISVEWYQDVKINPVVTVDLVNSIAEQFGGHTNPTGQEKYDAVLGWIRSFFTSGFDVGSIQPDVFGIGQYWNADQDRVQASPINDSLGLPDLTSAQVAAINGNPAVQELYQNDHVNMRVVNWLRNNRPETPLMQYYRMDDFATSDGSNYVLNVYKGDINEVPNDVEHIRDALKSTPGTNVIQQFGDIFLSDRPYAEMADLHDPGFMTETRQASGALKSAS